jgi:hypothetical protein
MTDQEFDQLFDNGESILETLDLSTAHRINCPTDPMTNPYRALCAELHTALEKRCELSHLVNTLEEDRLLDRSAAALRANELLAQPVAVSERWPEFSDCDPQERVWAWNPVLDHWKLSRINRSVHTHWLPANALPTPEATND